MTEKSRKNLNILRTKRAFKVKHKSFLKSFQLQKNVSDLRVKFVSARRARVSYKYFLPLQVLDIQYLHECISFELKVRDKSCNFVAIYRSLARHKTNLENFPITLN